MNKQIIIFDWNGTLLDDAWFTLAIENEMLQKRGMKTVELDDYREMFCFPVIDYYVKLGYDFSVEPYEKLSEEFMDSYTKNYKDCRLTAGAEKVIKQLKADGKTLAILSMTMESQLQEQVNSFGLTECFDYIVGLDNIHAHSKVERAKQWMAETGIDPATAVMIGDSAHDAKTAEGMGVECVLVATGHESRRRLELTGEKVVDNLEEFYRNIE